MTFETDAIQRFLDLVKRAAQARSGEVRIDLREATMLASEIAIALGQIAKLQQAGQTDAQSTMLDGGELR